MIHKTLPNKRKLKKLMQCSSIKSPLLWYGSSFFLKKYYYAFVTKQMQKTHFLNGISSKKIKFLNCFKFNWCTSISYTIKKFTQEFHAPP
jgi:hypothetical protein